jgi:TonB family protein
VSAMKKKMQSALVITVGALALLVGMTAISPAAHAQDTIGGRKVKSKPQLVYPELAKNMHIAGSVKVEIVIAPNGTVKSAKALGGHPLLIESAVDAAKKFKFEPGPEETTADVKFDFNPNQ